MLGDYARVREGKPITLAQDSEPEPDIAVVSPLGATYRQRHPFPEDIFWLIEFSNTSLDKDLKPKRYIYAAAGIPEYWIVNLKAQHVIVLRNPHQGDYQSEEITNSGSLIPLAFPDITVAVTRLLHGAL